MTNAIEIVTRTMVRDGVKIDVQSMRRSIAFMMKEKGDLLTDAVMKTPPEDVSRVLCLISMDNYGRVVAYAAFICHMFVLEKVTDLQLVTMAEELVRSIKSTDVDVSRRDEQTLSLRVRRTLILLCVGLSLWFG